TGRRIYRTVPTTCTTSCAGPVDGRRRFAAIRDSAAVFRAADAVAQDADPRSLELDHLTRFEEPAQVHPASPAEGPASVHVTGPHALSLRDVRDHLRERPPHPVERSL